MHTNTLESPKDGKEKMGKSKNRRMQETFADHLRHVSKVYAPDQEAEVVLLDNAPWHRGGPMAKVRAENPHLKFQRQPAYGPQWNPIERFRKVLSRREDAPSVVQQPGGLEVFGPCQPQLLADRACPGQNPVFEPSHSGGKADSISQ